MACGRFFPETFQGVAVVVVYFSSSSIERPGPQEPPKKNLRCAVTASRKSASMKKKHGFIFINGRGCFNLFFRSILRACVCVLPSEVPKWARCLSKVTDVVLCSDFLHKLKFLC